jgi:Icc-related predicted phosphoesterase
VTLEADSPRTVWIAASGDIHAGIDDEARLRTMLERLDERTELVLLAGDLTQLGQVEEARVLAAACRNVAVPIVAVLGNHDWQSDRATEIAAVLADCGVVVLERSHTIVPLARTTVGIAGVKGFIGGFDKEWANFGEPLFREAYRETTRDVEALDTSLAGIGGCGVRVALLHYSPSAETLEGESERLWLVLGSERLAAPIVKHRPHLALHGHAHHGSLTGDLDGVPVHNVAMHVTGRDFWLFEVDIDNPREPRVV